MGTSNIKFTKTSVSINDGISSTEISYENITNIHWSRLTVPAEKGIPALVLSLLSLFAVINPQWLIQSTLGHVLVSVYTLAVIGSLKYAHQNRCSSIIITTENGYQHVVRFTDATQLDTVICEIPKQFS